MECDKQKEKTKLMNRPQWEEEFIFSIPETGGIKFCLWGISKLSAKSIIGEAFLSYNDIKFIPWLQRSISITSKTNGQNVGTLHLTIDDEVLSSENGERKVTIFAPMYENDKMILKPMNAIANDNGLLTLSEDFPSTQFLGRFPRSAIAIGPCLEPLHYRPQTDCKIRATPVAFTTQKV